MAARITGTKKDNSGEICEYILDTGETISKAEGVTKAKNGEITYLDKALSEGCVDAKGYQVCAVYEAALTNTADDVVLTPSFDVTTNEFVNENNSNVYALLAAANGSEETPTAFTYNRENATNVIAAKNALTYNGQSTITVTSGQTAKYYLILWLENLNESQPDMNKTLTGQITFSSEGGAQLKATFNFN